jgi:hypothetical protein
MNLFFDLCRVSLRSYDELIWTYEDCRKQIGGGVSSL